MYYLLIMGYEYLPPSILKTNKSRTGELHSRYQCSNLYDSLNTTTIETEPDQGNQVIQEAPIDHVEVDETQENVIKPVRKLISLKNPAKNITIGHIKNLKEPQNNTQEYISIKNHLNKPFTILIIVE